jgi:DNA-binding CsgD family transcriptional regulator
MIAYYRGDHSAARAYLEEALAIRRDVGDAWSTAQTLYSLGLVARASGDHPRALALFKEALDAPQALGNVFSVAQYLSGAAGALAELGLLTAAARLLGAAQAAFDKVPSRLHPVEQAQVTRDIDALRAALGEPAFTLAWTGGGSLSLAQAVLEAIEARPRPKGNRPDTAPGIAAPAASLTRREREVAALIAQGLTNRQIAAALTITEGTAGSHVEHILAKLGFGSRAQVAAWAVAAGLADGAA